MNLKSLLKNLKLHETTVSMILGAVVIIVTGILVVNYFSGRRGQTIPPLDIEDSETLPSTHTVQQGEDLWKISEKYYGTGYNWLDIAKENNIANPDQLVAGQEIKIPAVTPKLAQGGVSLSPEPTTQALVTSPTPTTGGQPLKVGKNAHKVAKGESLWKIAEIYFRSGYNWVDIAQENNIANPGLIEEGQELTIPDVESKIATVNNIGKEGISTETYTVIKGDSLWNIAVKAYGDGYKWVEIAKENGLVNPGLIHPGNLLSLPR